MPSPPSKTAFCAPRGHLKSSGPGRSLPLGYLKNSEDRGGWFQLAEPGRQALRRLGQTALREVWEPGSWPKSELLGLRDMVWGSPSIKSSIFMY